MLISGHNIDKRIFVIAEVGNNHEGSFDAACKMIELAATAGADAVKFQTIRPRSLVTSDQTARLETLSRFELSDDQFRQLASVAAQNGVLFMSTPFELAAVELLTPLVPAFKIASGDNNFLPLLEAVARTGKPVIMSAGLTEIDDIRFSKSFIERTWKRLGITQDLVILHCLTAYPTPPADANMQVISLLREELGCRVGYSDHTLGIEAALMSVALGARVIEKHFTLDKNHSAFRDHQLSADPDELSLLVRKIREHEVLLGHGFKSIAPSEQASLVPARRSIAVKRDLPASHVLSFDDLAWLRPGDGFSPGDEHLVLGKKLTRAIQGGSIIREEHLG